MEQRNATSDVGMERLTVGGGCFWCTEAVFRRIRGVADVTPGYSGGFVKNPTYEQVCTGTTGHAEVVEIVFDPKTVSREEILDVFFKTHDPTTVDRQGHDVGPQYRSVVFYRTAEQRAAAETLIAAYDRASTFGAPVVTELTPFDVFYPAEDFHRRYFEKNPGQGYCRAVIRPKVDKLEKEFKARLKLSAP